MKSDKSFTILKYDPIGGYWLKYINTLIRRKNNSFFAFTSGKTGSGKTYSTLSICERLDPEFDVNRICFDVMKFMDMISEPQKYGLKRGSAILFDEISVTIDSKASLNLINKVLKRVFSTIRSRGYIIFGTSPFKTFLDKSVRILLYAEFKTMSIDEKNKQVMLDGKELEFDDDANQGKGRLYRKRLRIAKEGKLYPLKITKVSLPSKELITAYEIEKDKFQTTLYAESKDEIKAHILREKMKVNKIIDKDSESESEKIPTLTEKEKLLKDYLDIGHTDKQAQDYFKVSKVQIWKRKKNIEKKGYSVGIQDIE